VLCYVLEHCLQCFDTWLGSRKGIPPVKKLSGGCWHSCLSARGVDLHMAQLIPLPLTVSCFSEILMVLPFWYRLTRVVLDEGPLNGCMCVGVLLRFGRIFIPLLPILWATRCIMFLTCLSVCLCACTYMHALAEAFFINF